MNYHHHPLSFYTSFIYLFVGLAGNSITTLAGIFLCIGTALMHYEYTTIRNKLDWCGMYFIFMAWIWHFAQLSHVVIGIAAVLLAAVYVYEIYSNTKLITNRNDFIGVMVACTLLAEWNAQSFPDALISGLLFALAFGIRQYGDQKPAIHDQTHAAWHVINGIGFYVMLLHLFY